MNKLNERLEQLNIDYQRNQKTINQSEPQRHFNENENQMNIKDMVKKEIAFLLGKCYFKVGKTVFKQVIGIPMGTDPDPFMANLFLYHYENKFIKELKKTDRLAACKFGNIWRYIDDLMEDKFIRYKSI